MESSFFNKLFTLHWKYKYIFLLHLKKIAENLWGYSKWGSELNSFCRQIEGADAAPRLVATNM